MQDLSGGGVERMRLALIAELRARGVHVTLILARRQGALDGSVPADLPVIVLDSQSMLGAVLPLARALRRLRPDVLVASLDHNNVTALLAGWLIQAGTRVVICQHNALSAELALGWKYRCVPWLYWLLQSRAHGVVAVSHGVADDLAAVAGIARHRITPIYNPVISGDFAARAQGAAPHAWLADGGAPVLVFAGRLTAQKDPALVLDALALLPDARLILLGEGPLRSELQQQAARLGIAARVAFAGFAANPLPWIAHAACLVLPSRYEGLGNVLIEALACGTPVVATDCPHGPAEILEGGRHGALVAVGDAPGLAAAIGGVLGSRPDRAALRARAASFTASACADAHQALFARLAAPRTRRAFGLDLCPLDAAQVVARVIGEPASSLRLIVTPNIDHVRLLRQPGFARAYAGADIVCPDGFPVLLYARLRGLALAGRVTGCELFARLAEHGDLGGKRVVVVTESSATSVSLCLWAQARGLTRLHAITAPPALGVDGAAQDGLARAITALRPDILVMTLGAPVSETFVHAHRAALPPCWVMCVGQAVRVLLGLTQRAPALWQRAGLEWLWRIRQEPLRLAGRYARDFAWFPVAIFRDLAKGRKQGLLS